MIKVDSSVVIDAPVERVWEYISNLGTMPEWDPGTIEVEWKRPVGIGSVAVVTVQQFGKRIVNWEITEWEPNHKIGFRVRSAGTLVTGAYTIETFEGNKTKLSRWVQVEVGGMLRLISPLVSRRARNDRHLEIENIKRIVEGQSKKT